MTYTTFSPPPGIPTLEATRTKNLTRPDNVFCTPGIQERLRTCAVVCDKRPTKTDHYPIQTIFDLPTTEAPRQARKDFHRVDWDIFDQALAARVAARHLPNDIGSVAVFDTVLDDLMHDLQATIDEHVPDAPDTPYAK
ncbi:hypothetical protein BV20DRAFT_956915 [Pilatotrama ljubarskyi]|nr:hypothetical protein BV20DRAFT_956915 [Pilatotrama ljubarskyi]